MNLRSASPDEVSARGVGIEPRGVLRPSHPSSLIPHPSSLPPVVAAEGLTKIYRRGAEKVRAREGVSFELAAGEFAAVVGPAGAGKPTLLHMLGCLGRPTSGRLLAGGGRVAGVRE